MRALAPVVRLQRPEILTPTARVLVIQGEIGSGKTRRAAAWVESEELAGRTVAPLLDRLERDHPAVQRILLVRTGLVDSVVDRFCRGAATIFDPGL